MIAPRIHKITFGLGLVWFAVTGFRTMAQKTASASGAVRAQTLSVGNKRYDAGKELPRLTKLYNLSADQTMKIEPILLEQQKQVHALGEDASLSAMDWGAAVKKVHQQTVLKVKLEMTDSQASKYLRDEAKRAKSSSDQGDDGADDGPPDGPPPGGPGGPGGGGPPGE